jgi:hypothetical protein
MVEILNLRVIPLNWSYVKVVIKGRQNVAKKYYEISIINLSAPEFYI